MEDQAGRTQKLTRSAPVGRMNLGGGLMAAAPAPGSALRLAFERVVCLDSPAPAPASDSQPAALPDPLDAPLPPSLGGDAGFGYSQQDGLFWCAGARGPETGCRETRGADALPAAAARPTSSRRKMLRPRACTRRRRRRVRPSAPLRPRQLVPSRLELAGWPPSADGGPGAARAGEPRAELAGVAAARQAAAPRCVPAPCGRQLSPAAGPTSRLATRRAATPAEPHRPRRAGFTDCGSQEDGPSASQPSQSQGGDGCGRPPRHAGTPFALASRGGGPAPIFPIAAAFQRAQILAIKRSVESPPALRNAYLDSEAPAAGARDADAHCGRAAPAGMSRYRADFKELQLLGRGSFASVHAVRGRLDGAPYAVKRTTRPLRTPAERRAALAEVHALAAAGAHENLVRYFSAWFEGDALYIQLELCAGGALGGGTRCALPEAQVADVMRCVAKALAHLHGRGIVHGDVKPDNIFACGGRRYALGDLGTAVPLRGGPGAEGDARYLPSEVLNGCFGALDRADVFALGASGYELASGVGLPKYGDEYQRLRQGLLQPLPGVSGAMQALLARCMSAYPAQRPSAEALAAAAPLQEARDDEMA
jgi:hypothetical protein